MIYIDTERCILCGACVRDCFAGQLYIEQDRVVFKNKGCIGCGHCLAVCPSEAVLMEGVKNSELTALPNGMPRLDPEEYLEFLKGRRTIRQFTKEKVSDEQLHMLLEAVRFSPTGANKQDVFVSIIEKEIPKFRGLVLETLLQHAVVVLRSEDALPKDKVYAAVWKSMYRRFYSSDNIDRLFFEAPTVIVLSSIYPQNAAIAAAHMESMVYSLGLGMLYSGFTITAAANSKEVRKFLQIPPHHVPVMCLVIGHPKVDYHRTVGRKPLKMMRK